MAELHALLAEFDSPERLIDAARRLGGQGWRLEAFTPFPVEGLDRMLGFADKRVPRAMLIGGATGALLGFLMQVATNLDYPLWIGGRPLIAVPAFLLICFEMLVLGAVLAGIGTMLIANRLPRLHHPVFAADRFDLSADDRFFLAILADAAFDRDAAGKALAALHPRAIIEVPA
ncbi:MAG: DUF3341 domain-containing protein [Pseudomonadota bacterium]|nr:DUF3341 domain-containing protein [Pseudomonadota bacterium]